MRFYLFLSGYGIRCPDLVVALSGNSIISSVFSELAASNLDPAEYFCTIAVFAFSALT